MPDKASLANAVIMITREGMGYAEPALQQKVLDTYLRLLLENNTLPGAICFYTEGVRLAVEGSPLLDRLKEVEQKGVHLIVCSTCLNHYGLAEKVRVGVIGGMPDIIAAQIEASKVITI